jgi:hypothetical protein
MWLTANRKIALRQCLVWLGVMVFSIVFQMVYYQHSHDVYSNYITYLWITPALLVAVNFVLGVLDYEGGTWTRFALNCGSGTLMVYFVISGIYEIALTYSTWTWLFFLMAVFFFAAALVLFLVHANAPDSGKHAKP